MSIVRAKVLCVGRHEHQNQWNKNEDGSLRVTYTYEFAFVTAGKDSPENTKFWEATPSGTLKLEAVRSDLYVCGQEYYLDFIPCTE